MIDGETLHLMQREQDFEKKVLVLFFQGQGKSINYTEIKNKTHLKSQANIVWIQIMKPVHYRWNNEESTYLILNESIEA